MEVKANADGTIEMSFNDLRDIRKFGEKLLDRITITSPMECVKCGQIIPSGSDVHRVQHDLPEGERLQWYDGSRPMDTLKLSHLGFKCVCLDCADHSSPVVGH